MKKTMLIGWIILSFCALGLGLINIPGVSAQALQDDDPSDVITLSDFGYQDVLLRGPIDQVKIPFSLPADWELGSEAKFKLDMAAHFSSILIGQEEPNLDTVVAGYLTVSLNGISLSPVAIQGPGEKSLEMVLPANALQPDPFSGKHELVIQWDSSATCNDLATSVILYASTNMVLPHTSKDFDLDLSQYPAPMYTEDLIFPAEVSLVVPDAPTEAELQAALSIAAGLGRLSDGELLFGLISAGDLNERDHGDNHLILVGRITAFSILGEQPLKSSGEGQGFIQILRSPWNDGRALLVVDGNSDQAIQMAGEAISAGELITGKDKDLAIIETVEIVTAFEELDVDQSIAELLHDDLIMKTVGSATQEISFYLPPGTSVSPEAYFNMIFNHSTLLDYLRSGVIVRINGLSIGSVRLSDASSTMNAVRMVIPPTAVHPGINTLEIQADLMPRDMCQDPRLESLWFTVFSDSTLHLPQAVIPIAGEVSDVLGSFPQPFVHAALSDTIFLMSQTDSAAWNVAAKLAYDLGLHSTVSMGNAGVRFSENTKAEELISNTIIVGQLEKLPLVASLFEILPVPFGEDQILTTEAQARISFQVSPDGDYGFLETARSAANPSASIFVVVGSSEKGLNWAGDALLNASMKRKLMQGNFTIIQGNKVIVENISKTMANVEIPSDNEDIVPALEGTPGPDEGPSLNLPDQYPWILPVWVAVIVIIIGLLIWEIIAMANRSRN
ncbi:MAG: cellulose biosynthesis cyclic di-GMP-binding regulatory protein BcsB [Anaerolineaceae bacterium]|nr:cellulose biosynthesis cyclic di-GMP-binding regulatory protein BcsB [Anaerolineaceae bacterium]